MNRLVMEELSYDRCELDVQAEYMCDMLKDEQRAIYETIIHKISCSEPCVCFVSGHGGTGKTFLWNAIITRFTAQGQIV